MSHRVIGEALKEKGFSLQSNRKTYEGNGHVDRDSQFEFINRKVEEFLSESQPVISVDAKKRELVGNAYDFLMDSEEFAADGISPQ
jgi:hypothetical protein